MLKGPLPQLLRAVVHDLHFPLGGRSRTVVAQELRGSLCGSGGRRREPRIHGEPLDGLAGCQTHLAKGAWHFFGGHHVAGDVARRLWAELVVAHVGNVEDDQDVAEAEAHGAEGSQHVAVHLLEGRLPPLVAAAAAARHRIAVGVVAEGDIGARDGEPRVGDLGGLCLVQGLREALQCGRGVDLHLRPVQVARHRLPDPLQRRRLELLRLGELVLGGLVLEVVERQLLAPRARLLGSHPRRHIGGLGLRLDALGAPGQERGHRRGAQHRHGAAQ
mmetsp:Transcript_86891/g.230158  ORF Transcript_86891/g.230158 Transcript_86891/m.230158 type:complete len:274 (-) Transcript_86891:42-863(-)